MPLEVYQSYNTTFGYKLDDTIEAVPSNYFNLEASTFTEEDNEIAKRIIELENKGIYGDDAMSIIEGRKKIIDFKPPKKINDINIDVPIETNKTGMNFMGTDGISNKYEEVTVDNFRSIAYHELNM